MERTHANQLELFAESRNYGAKRAHSSGSGRSFFTSIWSYEKVILSVIAVIVTSIISFCLGVEHGKSVTLAKTRARFDISAKAKTPDAALIATQVIPRQPATAMQLAFVPEAVKQPVAAPVVTAVLPEIKQNRTVALSTGHYTIQLASYKTKENAQKAAKLLKKRGLAPVVLAKGSYTIVCVGNFTNKNAAQSRITEFRKQYQNCYIRRL